MIQQYLVERASLGSLILCIFLFYFTYPPYVFDEGTHQFQMLFPLFDTKRPQKNGD
jgi:hypothetical protein